MTVDQRSFDFQGAAPAFCHPLLKFAGGKVWLTKILAIRLHAHLVAVRGTYVEPFAGGLSMGLAVGWPDSVYADACADLANLYREVSIDPGAVADEIDALREEAGERTYYRIRESVWPANRGELSAAALVARTIWLNKNCFNGLFRYGRKDGRFNVPWGKRDKVVLPSREHVHRASAALRGSRVRCGDFAETLATAAIGRDLSRLVVYLDPPYGAKLKDVSTRGARDRGGGSGVFTGYSTSFAWEDQVRLAEWARTLAKAGALVVASNAWSDDVLDLYRDGFSLFQVGVRHSVGATADRRGRRAEVLAVSEAHASVLDSVPVKVVRRR